jgi:DNA polymerase-3 subunit epsilon
MRQVILDTETTGLEVSQGHRIIEVGCVELVNRRPTGRTFHHYVNPNRDIDAGATAVHGITLAKLADKPRFEQIAEEFLAFIDGAELVAHNARFDVGFLDQELKFFAMRKGGEAVTIRSRCRVLDTLALAKEMHPGQRNGLDALCKRYSVDNSHREYHGALLDARILADVYLAMTGGQSALALDEGARNALEEAVAVLPVERRAGALPVIEPSAAEMAAHEQLLVIIDKASGGKTLWRVDAKLN